MLIERENELHTLAQAHSRVPDNGGRVLLIYGDAGIGKTSLIREFTRTLPDAVRVAIGMCDPVGTPRPLGPVREIAQTVLGSQMLDDTALTECLMQRLANAKHTQVIVLEDMHWADQASIDWLKYFCRRIALIPALLVVTFRDVEVDTTHPLSTALGVIPNDRTERLKLASLSQEGVAAFDLPPEVPAERLHEITGGNPFFVTEILANSEDLGSVPESIRDAVNSRINQLPDHLRNVLEVGSCFPGEIDPVLLEGAVGRSVEEDLVDADRLNFFVCSGNGYRFRHELARLATQERLSASEKQRIHALLLASQATKNDKEHVLAEIVHHAVGANDREAVLHYGVVAAKDAARTGAHREAAQYLFAAMTYAEDARPAVAAEIYEMWAYEAGLALTIDQEVIDARERAVALWRSLGQMERVGENLRWLSRLHWYRGEPAKAQAYLEEAIEILQQVPSEATATAFSLRAQFHMLRDEMKEAQEWGNKALEVADSVNALEVKAHALNTIGAAMLFRGDLTGEDPLRESLSLSLEHDFHEQAARAYTNLSECLIELGEIERAELLLEEGITFDISHDLDAWTYYLIGRKAQLRFEQDRYGEAVDIATSVLSRGNQTILMQMPAKIILARSLLRLGETNAKKQMEVALEDALQVGELQYIAAVRVMFVEAGVLWGQPGIAKTHIQEMMKLSSSALSPRKWADFVFWASRLGDASADKIGETFPAAFVLDSDRRYQSAADAFHQMGSKFLAATSLCGLATHEALSTADSWYVEIGATAGRKYIRRSFDCSTAMLPTLSRGKYKASRRHPYGLTGKEQVVLHQIVEGSSNGRIAKNLSRSKRTVENHVSSILSKFGVKDRIELILRAQAEPWILVEERSEARACPADSR